MRCFTLLMTLVNIASSEEEAVEDVCLPLKLMER
jgi:hypothetical protein